MKFLRHLFWLLVIVSTTYNAQYSLDSLFKVYNNQKLYDTSRLRALSYIIGQFDNIDTNLFYVNKLIKESKEKRDPKHFAIGLKYYADYIIKKDKNNLDSSIIYYKKVIPIFDSIKEYKLYVAASVNAANLLKKDAPEDAIELYEKAYKISLKINWLKAQAAILNGIAKIYFNRRFLDKHSAEKSLEFFSKSLELKKKNNFPNKSKLTTLQGLLDLTIQVPTLLPLDSVGSLLSEFQNIAINLDFKKYIASSYYLEATYLIDRSKLLERKLNNDEVINLYNKALIMFDSLGNESAVFNNIFALSSIYLDMSQPKKCISLIETAEPFVKTLDPSTDHRVFSFFRQIGKSYYYIKKYERAYHYLEKAYEAEFLYSKHNLDNELYKIESDINYNNKKLLDSINFEKRIQIEKLAQDNLKLDIKQKESSRNYIFIILVVVVVALGFIANRLNVINKQRKEITAINDEMNESIRYAQRLQEGILVSEDLQKEWIPKSFIYFKPKDVVSGDFYWLESVGNKVYIAVADCTGHGIPGAMVSMICSAALNKSLYEDFVSEPSKILDNCRAIVEERFVRSKDQIKDGMDISLCVLDKKTNILKWAGANNPLWVIKKESEKVDAIRADKQPVGYVEKPTRFTQYEIQLQKGDSVYLFSDGFQDQFGGEKGKKYMVGKMKKFILSIKEQTMDRQLVSLDNEFNRWKGNHEQVDDVCVIGFRIT